MRGRNSFEIVYRHTVIIVRRAVESVLKLQSQSANQNRPDKQSMPLLAKRLISCLTSLV